MEWLILYPITSANTTLGENFVRIGDSVAISWMPGLRESLGNQGSKIQLLTKEQCPAIELQVERSDDKAGFAD